MYLTLRQLPPLILERIYWDSHDQLTDELIVQYSLTVEQSAGIAGIKKDILRGAISLSDLLMQLQTLKIDDAAARNIAKELVSKYFFLFQDFFGDLTSLLVQVGATEEECISYARSILNPSNTLRSFLIDSFPDVDIESIAPERVKAFLDILFECARGDTTEGVVRDRVKALFPDTSFQETVADTIEDLKVFGILSPDWEWYYTHLVEHISQATVPLFDQPIHEYLKATWGDETPVNAIWEYKLLNRFSKLSPEIQTWLLSDGLKNSVSLLEVEHTVKGLFPLLIRATLNEIPFQDLPAILHRDLDMELENAARVSTALHALLPPEIVVPYSSTTPIMQNESKPTPPNPAPEASYESEKDKAPRRFEPTRPIAQSSIDHAKIVDKILETAGLQIQDPALLQRTKDILTKRIRDIRDAIETRELLMEAFEKSGQEIDHKTAIKVVKEASGYATKLKNGEVPDFAIVRPPEPKGVEKAAPSSASQQEKKAEMPATPAKTEIPVQGKKVTPQARSRIKIKPHFGVSGRIQKAAETPAPAPKEEKQQFAIEDVEGVPMIIQKPRATMPMVQQQRNQQTSRSTPSNTVQSAPPQQRPAQNRQMQTQEIRIKQSGNPSPYRVPLADVKMATRLMDPVDELRSFTLKDFRRLSTDPGQAIKRIYQKIKLLEKDSASQKVSGINAWKESEVGKLYGQIGQESFGSGKSIQEIMKTRQQQGKPVLTESEFDALMELNEMLRF